MAYQTVMTTIARIPDEAIAETGLDIREVASAIAGVLGKHLVTERCPHSRQWLIQLPQRKEVLR